MNDKLTFFIFLASTYFFNFSFADVVPPAESTTLSKEALAQELVLAIKLNEKLDKSFIAAENYMKQTAKSADAQLKKNHETALKKFEELKAKTNQNALADFKKEIASQFTAPEIKYLIQLINYVPYQKFQSFLTSKKYNELMGSAFGLAAESFKGAKLPSALAPSMTVPPPSKNDPNKTK